MRILEVEHRVARVNDALQFRVQRHGRVVEVHGQDGHLANSNLLGFVHGLHALCLVIAQLRLFHERIVLRVRIFAVVVRAVGQQIVGKSLPDFLYRLQE